MPVKSPNSSGRVPTRLLLRRSSFVTRPLLSVVTPDHMPMGTSIPQLVFVLQFTPPALVYSAISAAVSASTLSPAALAPATVIWVTAALTTTVSYFTVLPNAGESGCAVPLAVTVIDVSTGSPDCCCCCRISCREMSELADTEGALSPPATASTAIASRVIVPAMV